MYKLYVNIIVMKTVPSLKVQDEIPPNLKDICNKICQQIPCDLQVFIGIDSTPITFTGNRNVILDIQKDGLILMTDFTSENKHTSTNLGIVDSENIIMNFVHDSLIPQLKREIK